MFWDLARLILDIYGSTVTADVIEYILTSYEMIKDKRHISFENIMFGSQHP